MNKYIERLPKQYQFTVKDFYKDADGWWICLDANGPYEFDGYASQYTIHENTQAEAMAQFRQCIHRKDSERYYLAYGSNLNLRQMRGRCPGAKLVGYAYLADYRLIFRGSDSSGYYLSIEPAYGRVVPCGVFTITPGDEQKLDLYEVFPQFYCKKEIPAFLNSLDGNSRTVSAMFYYLPKSSPVGFPATHYVQTCKEGYRDCGFDEEILRTAITDTWEELK